MLTTISYYPLAQKQNLVQTLFSSLPLRRAAFPVTLSAPAALFNTIEELVMPPGLDNLKHIVVLMMENRSFDHMLGYLKQD